MFARGWLFSGDFERGLQVFLYVSFRSWNLSPITIKWLACEYDGSEVSLLFRGLKLEEFWSFWVKKMTILWIESITKLLMTELPHSKIGFPSKFEFESSFVKRQIERSQSFFLWALRACASMTSTWANPTQNDNHVILLSEISEVKLGLDNLEHYQTRCSSLKAKGM